MSRFLAIDWDDTEGRYLLATAQKGTISVRKVGTFPLERPEEPELPEDDSDEEAPLVAPPDELTVLTTTLQRVCKEEKIEPCPTLLSLGRGKVEMIYQDLPPSKDSEIPILLKNQVIRELAGYSDFDPLDYLVLGGTKSEGLRLLALTIPLSSRQALVRRFRAVGRIPRRIGFRPLAAAELLFRSESAPGEQEQALMINFVGTEIDLLLLEGKKIVSLRSVRLPDRLAAGEAMRRVAEEVDRTVAIEGNEASEQAIRRIFVFGDRNDWAGLDEHLRSRELELVVIDPFTLPFVRTETPPEQSGRFAPLLGMLAEDAFAVQKSRNADRIDFLHPKEAPKATNYVRIVLLMFVMLAVTGYGLYYWNQGVVRDMEEKLAVLEKEYKEESAKYALIRPQFNILQQTRVWASKEVVWLDELRELSICLPSRQDMVVSRISFDVNETDPRFAGVIQLSGMVREDSVLMVLRNNLQQRGRYLMQHPQTSVNPAGGGYPRLFQVSIMRFRNIRTPATQQQQLQQQQQQQQQTRQQFQQQQQSSQQQAPKR